VSEARLVTVLFTDLVGYSMLPMDQQTRVIQLLQEIVRDTPEFRRAQASEQLICLPTGDGMALVFFQNPVSAVQCAIEIARALRNHPDMKLRMGVHTGPVHRIPDINTNRNVSGGGINLAQRVMDCGDAGHILVSKSVADILSQLSDWAQCLHDLGVHEVKHGVKVHLVNLHTADAGNPEIPQKLQRRPDIPQPPQPRPPKSRRGVYMLAGAALTIAILVFAGTQVANWRRANAGSPSPLGTPASVPSATEAAQISAPSSDRASAPEAALSGAQPPSAAPVEIAAAAKQQPAGNQTKASGSGATTQVRADPAIPAVKTLASAQAPTAGVATTLTPTAVPSQPLTIAPHQPDPSEAELEELEDLFLKLSARANTTKNALERLRAQQARQGLGLRGDMATAFDRQEFLLNQVDAAFKARDAARMKRQMDLAEKEVAKLEKFLGM